MIWDNIAIWNNEAGGILWDSDDPYTHGVTFRIYPNGKIKIDFESFQGD